MSIACFMYALYAVAVRYLTNRLPVMTVFFYNTLFFFLWSLLIYMKKSARVYAKDFFKEKDVKLGRWLILLTAFNIGAVILNTSALSRAPVALTTAFTGLQAIFVFLIMGVAILSF